MRAVATDFPPDLELVAAWRRGDELAAAQLVHRHAASLGRFLAGAGAPSGEVDDLVQETFFKAFRGLDGWRAEGSFRGWLFRIGGNLLRDRFRRERGRVYVELDDADLPDASDPAGEFAADEAGARLARGLEGLPRMQREVFLLRVQQGLAYEEIAEALGTSPGAARVHYHHAMKRLKDLVR